MPLSPKGMVDKEMILVLRDGKVVKLENESQVRTTEVNPDIVISAKGKLLTLDSEKMMEYRVADILLAPKKLEVTHS